MCSFKMKINGCRSIPDKVKVVVLGQTGCSAGL